MGLRLQLRKQQAEAGDIVLLYGDESEALTHPYLARAWAKSGADLRVPAPGQAKKVGMLGRSITSRANSSSIPAPPSAAAISSPIWSNSTVSSDSSPGDRPSRRDLKAHHLAHQTFTDVATLDQAIHDAVIDLNRARIPDPLAMPRISA